MRAARAIFRQYLLTALRDRFDLFWTLVFPVILMTILNLVFANVGNQAAVTMTVGLVNLDQDYPEGVAAIVERTLLEISQQETWLKVHQSHKGQQAELEALEKGKRHIVIVIPAGFSSAVRRNLPLAAGNQPLIPAEIMVYSRPNDQLSEAAVSAFGQVLNGINKSIAIEAGFADPRMLVGFKTCEVAVQGRVFSFASYIIPGILIMNFLTTGLSVVVGGLLAYR
ncbi:MAG: ABC transporter permease, partial [Limnochordia bacterium]